MKIFVTCPHTGCYVDIEIERFDGACKCWMCGRGVAAVHDCEYDRETGEGDCYDYAEPMEDE